MIPIILEDMAQKEGKHKIKNAYWESINVDVTRVPLPCADYVLLNDKSADVIKRKANRGMSLKKMDFLGTYKVAVDSKFGIQELIGDICGKQHERFRDECILAQNNGIKLYFVVENEAEWLDKKKTIKNDVVRSIDDLFRWKNKRAFLWRNGKQLYPNATKGSTLAKACITMKEKYGCEFVFCEPKDSGRIILDILLRGTDDGDY